MKRLVAAAALILLAACKPLPPLPNDATPYAQTEEGLTLVFVDPELKGAEQDAQRLQVRVARALQGEGGSLLVEKETVRGFQAPFKSLLRVSKGGVSLLDERGKPLAQILPEGFPERDAWESNGTRYTLLGRAAWSGAAMLPPTVDPIGVWVEARSAHGPRSRSLYLKGLGEVETLEERPGGAWICVNRLQRRGFVDAPAPAAVPAPSPAPVKAKPIKAKPAKAK